MGIFDKAKNVAKRATRLDDAAKVFGKELVRGVRKEANTPGTQGSRFASAPLGQFYLPGKVQKALSFVAPSPRETIDTQRNFAKNPSPRTGLSAGLNALSIATLPSLVSGVPRLGIAGARAGARVANRPGLRAALSSELGAARLPGAAAKGAPKTNMATAMEKAERVVQRKMATNLADVTKSVPTQTEFTIARKGGEIHVNDVPFSQLRGEAANKMGLTPSIVKSEGFLTAFSQVNRGKATTMTFRAEGATAPVARAATAGAAKVTQAAPAVAKAAPKADSPAAAVASRATGKIKPKLPTAAKPDFVPEAAAAKAPKAPAKDPTRAAGEVKTRAAKPNELARMDEVGKIQDEIATGARPVSSPAQPAPKSVTTVKPKLGGGTKPAAPAAAPAPTSAAPKPAIKASVPKAAPAAAAKTEATAEDSLRSAMQALATGGKVKRGALSSAARKFGVSRQRAHEVFRSEAKRAGAVPAQGSATSAASKVTPKMPASSAPKPQVGNATPAQAAPKAAPNTAAAPQASAPATAATPTQGTVRIARPKTPTAPSRASRVASAAVKAFPKKTAGVIAAAGAGAVLLSQRDNIGIGSNAGDTPASASEDRAWIDNLPEDLRANVKGLYEVKDKKGEAGLKSLVEGLQEAQASPEFPTEAELQHPHVSAEWGDDYNKLLKDPVFNRSPEQAQQEVLKSVRKKRDKMLRDSVERAYQRISTREENDRIRRT